MINSNVKDKNYFVFLDVDQTLIRFKSMTEFMIYFLYEQTTLCVANLAYRQREFENICSVVSDAEVSRETLNWRYYQLFRGISKIEFGELASSWMLNKLNAGGMFVDLTLEAYQEHKTKGAHLVLVSGSFEELLMPIKQHIHAEALLCSKLEVEDGIYTGNLLCQVIGEGKWKVISEYIDGKEVDLSLCYAYGDHQSDLCFMQRTGFPVVVGNDPELSKLASEKGWQILAF